MKAGYIQPPGGGCFAFERIIGLGMCYLFTGGACQCSVRAGRLLSPRRGGYPLVWFCTAGQSAGTL